MNDTFSSSRFWIGIVLIAFGIYFLADNFYVLPFHFPRFFRQWEWIFILIGVILLLTSKNNHAGFVMIAIGIFFLWGMKVFWPLLLLFIGFILLKRNNFWAENKNSDGARDQDANNIEDYINEACAFGGCSKKVNIRNFKGGKITAIFGGSDLNLRESVLAEGRNYIDVLAIFGGGSLRIPKEWDVQIDAIPILGGISDKRLRTSESQDSSRVLVIKGVVIFGGIEITN